MGMQALLEGISLCQPQPKLPSELIKYLGKTFCAWHIAIPLLESHVFLFPEVWPLLSHHPDIISVNRASHLTGFCLTAGQVMALSGGRMQRYWQR